MTSNEINRAALALYCARAAGPGAAMTVMRAIALCIRNRVRQGWHDGDWLTNIEHAAEYGGNLPGAPFYLDPSNRDFQRWMHEVDDVYLGGMRVHGIEGADNSLEDSLQKCVYWADAREPMTPWFLSHVIDDPDHHPMRATMGTWFFYE